MTAPKAMHCIGDLEKFTMDILPRNALNFYRGGANEELTMCDNVEAFKRYKILPRVLQDVSRRDLGTTILGHNIAFPVCIAPTAMQRAVHPEGEVACARAAQSMGTAFTLSTMTTCSIEEVASAAPDALRFFQLYVYKDRDITRQLVRRAEDSGFMALFLTVDAPVLGKRLADEKDKFQLPPHLNFANFAGLAGCADIQVIGKSGLSSYVTSLFDASLTWDDVKWLKSITKLPIVLKGILAGADAKLAVDCGVAGIVVSNHGGRQLDTVPATIDVLRDVVTAVDGRCEVYLDGGIRCGTDVLKALALGARAVFIGRPAIYGLSYNGEQGVTQVLQILKEELSTAMALSGCSRISDVHRGLVAHQSNFSAKL